MCWPGSPLLAEIRSHCLKDFRQNRCGGVVVQINHKLIRDQPSRRPLSLATPFAFCILPSAFFPSPPSQPPLNLKTAEREVFALWDGVAAWAGPPGTRWWGRSRAIAGPLQYRCPTPVPGMSQEYFKGNSRTFQGHFKDNPSLFQASSKAIPRIFQAYSKDTSTMFQGCFKDVASILELPHPSLSRPAPPGQTSTARPPWCGATAAAVPKYETLNIKASACQT
jgi:hypothetical protein